MESPSLWFEIAPSTFEAVPEGFAVAGWGGSAGGTAGGHFGWCGEAPPESCKRQCLIAPTADVSSAPPEVPLERPLLKKREKRIARNDSLDTSESRRNAWLL
ncbi:hypothetical protein SKAU_G00299890 [Synaphobranchus kaupii]|uniref:Uncharacterized protein n=1 Tax=Synaphobranchus kaupii TaxID=118154 RepID=A0A9Q1EVI8_SYNKA|nr:hypothetical protein SKAU_G00299890 [Synaphobranchus kaupii]